MKTFKIIVLLAAFGFGTNSIAACSENLNAQETVYCIVDENATDKYYENEEAAKTARKAKKANTKTASIKK